VVGAVREAMSMTGIEGGMIVVGSGGDWMRWVCVDDVKDIKVTIGTIRILR